MVSSANPFDWSSFGRFAARMRQKRRKLKAAFTKRSEYALRHGFTSWRDDRHSRGHFVCRHGVLVFKEVPRSFAHRVDRKPTFIECVLQRLIIPSCLIVSGWCSAPRSDAKNVMASAECKEYPVVVICHTSHMPEDQNIVCCNP